MPDEKTQSKKACSETSFQTGPINPICKKEQQESKTVKNGLTSQSCRRLDRKCSKSLNDIWKQLSSENCCSKRSDTSLASKGDKNVKVYYNGTGIDANVANNKIARRRILNLLMLNAWRRQKLGFKSAQEDIHELKKKLDGFEMQVYVLKQLLNAEKKRVELANDNINDLIQKTEKSNKEKESLLKENVELETNFKILVEYCGKIENSMKNQENDIITARQEASNWEKQLEKKREKLKKMESEEAFLKEKIRQNEKVIMLKTLQVDQLTQSNVELQQKLDVQVPLWDETMAQVDLANSKLKESETIKNELQNAIEEKDKAIKELKSTIATLEKKIQEEDERNGLLTKTIMEKTNELAIVENKLEELSKNLWTGSVVKIASLCAKIPVACICTVGSLLLPIPSYRI